MVGVDDQAVLALREIQSELVPALLQPVGRPGRPQPFDERRRRLHHRGRCDRAAAAGVEVAPARRPHLARIAGVHRVPHLQAPLPEPAHPAVRERAGDVEVLVPGRGHGELEPLEVLRDVGQVVGLAVDRDLEQRAAAQRVAEAPGPAVGVEQRRDEVLRVPARARVLIEWLDEAGAHVLPQQHRAGHKDVHALLEQRVDVVREVRVAVDDPDVDVEAGRVGELPDVALHRTHIGICVRPQEREPGHLTRP